jgi:hypothetical protein
LFIGLAKWALSGKESAGLTCPEYLVNIALFLQKYKQVNLRRWYFGRNIEANLTSLRYVFPARAGAIDDKILTLDASLDLVRGH